MRVCTYTTLCTGLGAVLALTTARAHAAATVVEDFESYSNSSALNALVSNDTSNATVDLGASSGVGGSKAHGPRQRDYRQKLNRSMRRQALRSAFLAKALDGEILVVENLDLPELKTRAMATVLKNLHVERTFLVVTEDHKPELWRCTRNNPGAGMSVSTDLFAYQVIRPQRLVFTRQALENFVSMAGKQGAESNG